MKFTFDEIEQQYLFVKSLGYEFMTCKEYYFKKPYLKGDERIVINRVDIDLSVRKANRLLSIFNRNEIKASFFLRLHAPEYNPFSFENYRIISKIIESGHELGYHSEVIDQSIIWSEDPEVCLLRDLSVMEKMFGVKIESVASHGGSTGYNNLDFWLNRKPQSYKLLYEAYDKEPEFNLFQDSFYISDSSWTYWKCYDKGKFVPDDKRSFGEHAKDNHHLIYLLVHPDTYYDSHIYDNEK